MYEFFCHRLSLTVSQHVACVAWLHQILPAAEQQAIDGRANSRSGMKTNSIHEILPLERRIVDRAPHSENAAKLHDTRGREQAYTFCYLAGSCLFPIESHRRSTCCAVWYGWSRPQLLILEACRASVRARWTERGCCLRR
jgi:hypothetical protein